MSADSQPFLILGMHRSGTSLLASILQDWGVFLGEELVGAFEGNPRGHFEDTGILEFHEELLDARRESNLLAFDNGSMRQQPVTADFSEAEKDRARTLAEARRRPGLWGWKEPRTCLLLDLWREVLPEAAGIIVYRHPLEVYFSVLRRALNLDVLTQPHHIVRAFGIYCAPLADLVEKEPSRFPAVSADAAFSDLDALAKVLQERLPINADVARARERFAPEEFRQMPISPALHRFFTFLFPEEARIFDRLQESASLAREFAPEGPADAELDALREQLASLPVFAEAAARKPLFPILEAAAAQQAGWDLAAMREKALQALEERIENYRETERGYAKQGKDLDAAWERVTSLGDEYNQKIDEYTRLWAEHERLGHGWNDLVENYKKVLQQSKEHQVRIDELWKEVDELKGFLREEQEESRAKEQELSAKEQELSDRDEELAEAYKEIAALRETLQQMENSPSWKLTSPLRKFSKSPESNIKAPSDT